MSYAYLGGMTIGGALPGAALAMIALKATLTTQLSAALSANASIQANLGVNIGANIQAAIDAVLSGRLLLALQATATVDIQAGLQASLALNVALIAALQAQLKLVLDPGVAGMHAFVVDALVKDLGADANSALAQMPSPPNNLGHALIIASDLPAAWQAFGKWAITS